jgi:hypothetical protein
MGNCDVLDWTPESADPDDCTHNVRRLMSTLEKIELVRDRFSLLMVPLESPRLSSVAQFLKDHTSEQILAIMRGCWLSHSILSQSVWYDIQREYSLALDLEAALDQWVEIAMGTLPDYITDAWIY